jgi:hypothetical protein
MFSKHDPRAAALSAVHEARVTVAGSGYDGRPEFLIDDDLDWGTLNELFDDGFITFDSDAARPSPVTATAKGTLALTVLFGILPAPEPVHEQAPVDDDYNDGDFEDDEDDYDDSEGPSAASDADDICVEYFGLGLQCLEFVNGKEFRDSVRKHGYELLIDSSGVSQGTLALDQPLAGQNSYLSVLDPITGGRFFVLYDDETWSGLESPGFAEILALMDSYCKEKFQSRLFMAEPETDEEEDELDLWVGKDHPFYGLEYDFATGRYVR